MSSFGKHNVSTHSRPKAAVGGSDVGCQAADVSTHSRPKAAGGEGVAVEAALLFQHTAARRRLGGNGHHKKFIVSCFNTQPPEGGWF